MKAEELMINDWFSFNGKAGQIGIIDNWDGEVSYFNGDAEGILTFGFDDIKPIPLTAEILEKNEFGLQEQDFTDKLYELKHCLYLEPYSIGFSVGCSITNYDHFNIHTRMLSSFCKVYYVHELQHVLRLCGLGELANNFKI